MARKKTISATGSGAKTQQLHLNLKINTLESFDPRFEVTWTLSEFLIKKMQALNLTGSIHFLLFFRIIKEYKETEEDGSVTIKITEVERGVAKVKDGRKFFLLNQPGTFKIECYLVGNDQSRYTLADFKSRLLDKDIDYTLFVYKDNTVYVNNTQSVEVGPEFFVELPNSRFHRFVNSFYNNPPKDQCHFRSRVLALPLAMLLVVLISCLTLCLMTLYGLIRITFRTITSERKATWFSIFKLWKLKQVFTEFTTIFLDMPEANSANGYDSQFFKVSKNGLERNPFMSEFLYTYWVILSSAAFIYLMVCLPLQLIRYKAYVYASAGLLICLFFALGAATLVFICVAAKYLFYLAKDTYQSKKLRKDSVQKKKPLEVSYGEYSRVTLKGSLQKSIVDDASDSVRLIYSRAKHKVCKPYRV